MEVSIWNYRKNVTELNYWNINGHHVIQNVWICFICWISSFEIIWFYFIRCVVLYCLFVFNETLFMFSTVKFEWSSDLTLNEVGHHLQFNSRRPYFLFWTKLLNLFPKILSKSRIFWKLSRRRQGVIFLKYSCPRKNFLN